MKFSMIFPALLVTVGMGAGCSFKIDEDVLNGGDPDEVRSLGDFKSVTNFSDADVVLVQDTAGNGLDPGDVSVVCESGFNADVDASVDGDGNLAIDFAANVASVLGCEVLIIVDGVEEIVGDGEGDIVCEDPLPDVKNIEVNGNGSIDLAAVEADELFILVTGNGSLNIDDLSVDMLHVDLRGNGDISLAGEATNADLKISGNGDFQAQGLTVAETLDALLNGAGNGVVTVLGTVNADVSGDVTLDVYGGAQPGDIVESDGGKVTFH